MEYKNNQNDGEMNEENLEQDLHNTMDRMANGFQDMNQRLERIERNLSGMVNSIRAKRVRSLMTDYAQGVDPKDGAEKAFFNRVVWRSEDDPTDIDGYGHEYQRENDDGTLTIIRIQQIPEMEHLLVVFGVFDAPDSVREVTTIWVHNMLESRAYIAEFLNFDALAQVDLE